MPLLTELGNGLGCDFYKDVAPERGWVCCRLAAHLTPPPPVWFFLDKIFAGRIVKIVSEADNSSTLSLEEEKLLTKYMDFYRALETGKRQPTTVAQEHFVRVTRGLTDAETIHERAYAKHMQLRAAQRAAIRGENPRDPADGPTPEWFPDEDWYRLRSRQRNDMRDD